jgi:alkylation response protein AidB-like acyl-CoA dehydrogenase
VSDKWRVGEVNEGWRVLQVALAFERVPVAQGELFRLYRRMVGWTTATEHLGGSLLEQPSVRQRMARMAVDQRMGALLAQRMTAVGAGASCRSSKGRWPSCSFRKRSRAMLR